MKVSVVIPCHNGARWLGEALDSVKGQTFAAHEVIVVDDASSDDSVSVAEKSGAVSRIIQVEHRNAAAARNAGVAVATGDWIAFLDADDFWYPSHLENASEMLCGSRDIAFLAHNDQLVFKEDGSSEMVDRDTRPPVTVPTSGISHDTYFAWFAQMAWFFPGSLVASRERFLTVGGFDVTQVRRHDFEMFFRLIHGQSWTYHPTPGAVYRFMINPDSISGNVVATSYFTLRALIKNEFLYAGAVMEQATEHWATRALRNSVGAQDNHLLRNVWRLASPRVGLAKRFLFWALLFLPGIVPAVRWLRQRRQSRAKPPGSSRLSRRPT